MAALTGQEIVSELSKRLRSRFSSTEFAEIYKDKPVQSMKTPCIFIHSVETSITPQLRNYARWDDMIDIRCHPGRMQTNIHTWARSVATMVLDCACTINIDNQQVRSTNATWRVEDDVLHVVVTYSFRVVEKLEEVPDMQTLTYGERIKQ